MDTPHPKRSRYCREISTGEKPGVSNFPLDLTVEILKKLPAKSLVRFRCVSKQWSSVIGSSRYFIDSIVTRSLTKPQRPHFIFHHYARDKPFFIFSSTYPHDAEKQKLTPKVSLPHQCFEYHYIRGLICCSMLEFQLVTIYNPTTRQSFDLPEIKSPTWSFEMTYTFFGCDPVMNQYKVLCLFNGLKTLEQTCRIFTLGGPNREWRNIQGIDENRYPTINDVYIDGTIYFGASILRFIKSPLHGRSKTKTALLNFNFKSERFDQVKTPKPLSNMLLDYYRHSMTIVNYGGKLGCICNNNGAEVWVMENAEKQKWSKMVFCLPNPPLRGLNVRNRFAGVTPDGEIFAFDGMFHHHAYPLYVYYYDSKRNSFRRVEIEGTGRKKIKDNDAGMRIIAVHDHVENPMWL